MEIKFGRSRRGPGIFPSQNPGFSTSALSDRAKRSRQSSCLAAEKATFSVIFTQKVTWDGFFLDAKATAIVGFLRDRHYQAVLPSIVAPALYMGLGSHIMYPNLLKLWNNYFTLHKQELKPLTRVIREMVNRSFFNKLPELTHGKSGPYEEVLLYIGSEQIRYLSNLRKQGIELLAAHNHTLSGHPVFPAFA